MGLEANNNPWLALSTYEERDEYRFKGRDKDIENMLQLIRQNEYVVCYAASGDGKSSLVNAGVCPSIRREGMFPIKIVFTSDEYDGKGIPMLPEGKGVDFDKLILSKIEQNIKAFRDEFAAKHGIDEEFELGFEKLERYQDLDVSSLWWKLRTETIQIPFGEFDYIPVLIFDQFEEMFRAKWKADFFKWLEILSKDICPHELQASHIVSTERLPGKKLFKMIFSMRYEYVGELDYWCSQRTYIPQIMQNRYFLKPLTRTQAISAIECQLNNDEVIKRIQNNSDIIVDNIVENYASRGTDADEVSALMLSLVCYVLYEEWRKNKDFLLTSISLNNIVYDYYRDQLKNIGITDKQRRILEEVLISPQKTRLRIAVSDPRFVKVGVDQYLDENKHNNNIVSTHILKKMIINGESYVEFIHDRLMYAICEKMIVERDVIKQIYLEKRKRNIIYSSIILLSVVAFVLFSKKSLTFDNKQVALQNDTISNDITLEKEDLELSGLGYIDFQAATTLKLARNVKNNKNIHCYKNVLYVNDRVYYAGQAKELIFADETQSKYDIHLGENVDNVVILHPKTIQSINFENKRTRLLIPYSSYEECIMSSVFENVYFEEMGLFSTLLKRLRYEICTQGENIPIWLSWFISFMISFILAIRYLRKSSLYKRLTGIFLIAVLSVLVYIIMIEISWLWEIPFFYGVYYLMIILVVWPICHYIYSIRGKTDSKNKTEDKAKYQICILYNSDSGRNVARELRDKLIENGILMSDINLNLSIVRNGEFSFDAAMLSVVSSLRCVAIFSEGDIVNGNIDSNEYWKVLNHSHLIHPIVYCDKGEVDMESIYTELMQKTAVPIFMPYLIRKGNVECEPVSDFLLSLKQKPLHKLEFGKILKLILLLCIIGWSISIIILIELP